MSHTFCFVQVAQRSKHDLHLCLEWHHTSYCGPWASHDLALACLANPILPLSLYIQCSLSWPHFVPRKHQLFPVLGLFMCISSVWRTLPAGHCLFGSFLSLDLFCASGVSGHPAEGGLSSSLYSLSPSALVLHSAFCDQCGRDHVHSSETILINVKSVYSIARQPTRNSTLLLRVVGH